MAGFSIQRFEEARRENGICYWDALEFMRDLGYETWASFQAVINKAVASCARLNLDATENFISHTVEVDGKPTKTYRLTRFACFLISMHADSKKPEVAQAKTVLAAIADRLVQDRIDANDLARLEAREDLKEADKLLSAAGKAGGLVRGDDYAIFKDAGFRGMYNMSLRQLKDRKGVAEGDVLYDYVGLEELAGNLFRVTQTTARIKAQRVQGLNNLSSTAEQVGKEVRRMMIQNAGTPPEALPIEHKIGDVKKRLTRASKEMVKLDNKGKGRPKSKAGA